MTSQLPAFPLKTLSYQTDRAVTNLYDISKILLNQEDLLVSGTNAAGHHVGYTLRVAKEKQALVTQAPRQLVGRFQTIHEVQFILTTTEDTSKKVWHALQVLYTFPVLGTFQVARATDFPNGQGKAQFSFGPHLKGSVSIKFSEDLKSATIQYEYTALGRKVETTVVDVPFVPSDFPTKPF